MNQPMNQPINQPQPPMPPQPLLPPYPVNGLTAGPGGVSIGAVMPCADSIDAKTYMRNSGNGNQMECFSPDHKNNTGWILCDGSSVYIVMYPRLFNAVGFTYGKDGEDRFKVPDYRGFFFRALAVNGDQDPGLKEPPAALDKRTKAAGGLDNGVGSTQECNVQMHEHHYYNFPGVPTAVEQGAGTADTAQKDSTPKTTGLLIDDKDAQGTESRPKNIYVNCLIHAGLPGVIR